MDKTKINYWIDVGMGIAFILAFITGIFKFPNLTQYFTAVFRLISARTISKIHDWSGLIMGIFVFVHLALHWTWIVAMTKRMFKRQ
jgi:hypothetical protein